MLGLVWLLCLGTTLVCALAVYTFSELVIQVRGGHGGVPAEAPAVGSNACFVRLGPLGPRRLCPGPPWRPLPSRALFSFLFCLNTLPIFLSFCFLVFFWFLFSSATPVFHPPSSPSHAPSCAV